MQTRRRLSFHIQEEVSENESQDGVQNRLESFTHYIYRVGYS